MAKKFSELEARMTAEARAKAEALYEQHLREMPLHELRRARELAQAQLAESMHISQAAVSKIESHADVYVSTVRNFVEAMGGRLEIRAVFADGQYLLQTGFRVLDEKQNTKAKPRSRRPLMPKTA